jgi:DNA topoisomerase IB
MSRTSTLPKRLQPMLATLTDAPFNDASWVFEDKCDGFRMIAEIRKGKVALYSRNGTIISHSYLEVAGALEGVKADAVIDDNQAEAKRNVVAAIEKVAKQLGNTPAICRKSYVHPEVLTAHMSGEFVNLIETKIALKFRRQYAQLTADEIMVLAFLHKRLKAIKAAETK